MGETIVRGKKTAPEQVSKETVVGASVEYGVRNPASDFCRRPNKEGVNITYEGPSKLESRKSGVSAGNTQSKKHVSSGKGQ